MYECSDCGIHQLTEAMRKKMKIHQLAKTMSKQENKTPREFPEPEPLAILPTMYLWGRFSGDVHEDLPTNIYHIWPFFRNDSQPKCCLWQRKFWDHLGCGL